MMVFVEFCLYVHWANLLTNLHLKSYYYIRFAETRLFYGVESTFWLNIVSGRHALY